MHRTTGAPQQPKEKKEVPKPVVKQTTVESDELSDETVAVIMATLTAYYQQTGSNCEFIVKRIKRL